MCAVDLNFYSGLAILSLGILGRDVSRETVVLWTVILEAAERKELGGAHHLDVVE